MINNSPLKDKRIVAVSGGFDPVHIGHVRLFEKAKDLGDELVVILNNDNWLKSKKGYVFMPEEERKEILEAFENVDKVIISNHPVDPDNMSIASDLRKIKPDIFANGGDRTKKELTKEGKEEIETCESIGCEVVFGIGHGGKVQSSSKLVDEYKK